MDEVIHLVNHLQCDQHHAFEKFTINRLLESWLVPVAEVDPSPGGRYELFWEPHDRGNNSTIGCRITAITVDQLLAFEWRSPKQFQHFANQADPLTHVVICFVPSQNGTNVHLIHTGWRSSAEWKEAKQWQEQAWRKAFENLAKKVNGERA